MHGPGTPGAEADHRLAGIVLDGDEEHAVLLEGDHEADTVPFYLMALVVA